MRRLRRILAAMVGAVLALGIAMFLWLSMTAVSASELPPLKDGDIIFQYSGSRQSLPILIASRSVYTHMGIIAVSRAGEPVVLEASNPVKATPLDEWIGRGVGGRITIKRHEGLTAAQASGVLAAADALMGKPYDIFFLDGRDEIYCSELVRIAYEDGAQIELGHSEKVGSLDIDWAPVRKLIEQRWQRHPMCRNGQKDNFTACYKAILEQSLVTPVSIARDPNLTLVFTNFGPAAE